MSETTEKEFQDLTLEERMAKVDERTGDQPDRISHPHQLLDIRGQKMFIVLSPFGKEDNIGTCFMIEWDAGDIKDHRGIIVTKETVLSFDEGEKYICYSSSDPDNGISLKDFNIVPNSYNNHAVFTTLEAAEAYIMYRKMIFAEDQSIAELEGDYAAHFTTDDVARLLKAEQSESSSE